MTNDFQDNINLFSQKIGLLQQNLGSLTEEDEEKVVDFQAKCLALFNKSKDEGKSLEDFGVPKGNLYFIDTAEQLEKIADEGAKLSYPEVERAREKVNEGKGDFLGAVPGFAKIGVKLGLIDKSAMDIGLQAQSAARIYQFAKDVEDFKASGNKPSKVQNPLEVNGGGLYRFIKNERDPAEILEAQSANMLAETYKAHEEYVAMYGVESSVDAGFVDFFKAKAAGYMAEAVKNYDQIGDEKAANAAQSVAEGIKADTNQDNVSEYKTYTRFVNSVMRDSITVNEKQREELQSYLKYVGEGPSAPKHDTKPKI